MNLEAVAALWTAVAVGAVVTVKAAAVATSVTAAAVAAAVTVNTAAATVATAVVTVNTAAGTDGLTCSQPGSESLEVGAELGFSSRELLQGQLGRMSTVDCIHQIVSLVHHNDAALQMQLQGVSAFLQHTARSCMTANLHHVTNVHLHSWAPRARLAASIRCLAYHKRAALQVQLQGRPATGSCVVINHCKIYRCFIVVNLTLSSEAWLFFLSICLFALSHLQHHGHSQRQ